MKRDITIASSAAAVGLACVLGAFLALREDNRFLTVILCVLAIAAAGVALAIMVKVARSAR